MKHLLFLMCLFTGLFFIFNPTISAQVFWEDNFEGTDPNLGGGDRDAPNHADGDNGSGPGVCGAGDYFFRTDNPGGTGDPDGLDVTFTNIEGSFYWRGEDVDDCFANPDQLNFTGIDISGRNDLDFTGRFGVRSGNTLWEAGDYIEVSYQIDGGGYTLALAFVSDLVSGAFGNLAQDNNLDGTADGTILSESLTSFMFDIPTTGATLDLRVEILADGGGEEFAFDLFQVSETIVNVTDLATTNLTVYPNPTTGMVQLPELAAERVEIYDLRGSLIMKSKQAIRQLDLTMQPMGLYFLKIYTKQEVYSARVLKQ